MSADIGPMEWLLIGEYHFTLDRVHLVDSQWRKSEVPVMSDTLLPPSPTDDKTNIAIPSGDVFESDMTKDDPGPSNYVPEQLEDNKTDTPADLEFTAPRDFASLEGIVRPRQMLPLPRRSLPQSQSVPKSDSPPPSHTQYPFPPNFQTPGCSRYPATPPHKISSPPPPTHEDALSQFSNEPPSLPLIRSPEPRDEVKPMTPPPMVDLPGPRSDTPSARSETEVNAQLVCDEACKEPEAQPPSPLTVKPQPLPDPFQLGQQALEFLQL